MAASLFFCGVLRRVVVAGPFAPSVLFVLVDMFEGQQEEHDDFFEGIAFEAIGHGSSSWLQVAGR